MCTLRFGKASLKAFSLAPLKRGMTTTEIFEAMKLHPEAKIPCRQTEGAAGCDIYSISSGTINPKEVGDIHTGVAISVPKGFVGVIYSRSGHSLKYSLEVVGDDVHRGDIGELIVRFRNNGKISFTYSKGDRVAQIVFIRICDAELNVVQELGSTKRGTCGFGSTGER
jgi:dUTP pyrophosphatase